MKPLPRGIYIVVLSLALLAIALSACASTGIAASPPTATSVANISAVAPDFTQTATASLAPTTPQTGTLAGATIVKPPQSDLFGAVAITDSTQKTNANVVAPVGQYRLATYNGEKHEANTVAFNEMAVARGPGLVAGATTTSVYDSTVAATGPPTTTSFGIPVATFSC
jgi:hypothetical protein